MRDDSSLRSKRFAYRGQPYASTTTLTSDRLSAATSYEFIKALKVTSPTFVWKIQGIAATQGGSVASTAWNFSATRRKPAGEGCNSFPQSVV